MSDDKRSKCFTLFLLAVQPRADEIVIGKKYGKNVECTKINHGNFKKWQQLVVYTALIVCCA